MSVLDNVALGAYLRGRSGVLRAALKLDGQRRRARGPRRRARSRGSAWREQAFDAAGSLPLGKQRIVEIARALAADPSLLLLDEPAAGLRYLEKQELAKLLHALKAEGMTILLVEHDMDFVMGVTDRLVVMDFGEKLAEGTPAEIQRNPAVARSLSRRGAMSGRSLCWRSTTCRWPTARSRPCTTFRWKSPKGQSSRSSVPTAPARPRCSARSWACCRAQGMIRYAGSPVGGLSVEQRVDRGLVLVPEKRELFASMKVSDNLELGAFARVRRRGPRGAARSRRRLRPLSPPVRAARPARRHAVRRRAADAGARPRADGPSRGC